MSPSEIDRLLRSHGVVAWGLTSRNTPISFDKFKLWVEDGKHGPLRYLADHRLDLRRDLGLYYADFSQALVMLFPYVQSRAQLEDIYQGPDWNGWKIASYTLGFKDQDYHHYLKEKLAAILNELKEHHGGLEGVQTLDVHPVLERDLAFRAGLGWFGKNSMLIHRQYGSFVMIGSLLLNQEIGEENTHQETDHCGHCTACIEACPTLAIDQNTRQIEAQKCISTFTIEEFKDAPPIEGHLERGGGEIFGCDICQDICPWNKRPLQRAVAEKSAERSRWIEFFLTRPRHQVREELQQLSNKQYKTFFKGSVFERLGKVGMLKNLKLYLKD